jgi:hypothetical protein
MVRQVGYLPELYEDARSKKYLKKLKASYAFKRVGELFGAFFSFTSHFKKIFSVVYEFLRACRWMDQPL